MELRDTMYMIISPNYKVRFRGEYFQNKIRYEKLKEMLDNWDKGTLDFKPTCPREIYDSQLYFMKNYIEILEKRAEMEGIYLDE